MVRLIRSGEAIIVDSTGIKPAAIDGHNHIDRIILVRKGLMFKCVPHL